MFITQVFLAQLWLCWFTFLLFYFVYNSPRSATSPQLQKSIEKNREKIEKKKGLPSSVSRSGCNLSRIMKVDSSFFTGSQIDESYKVMGFWEPAL